MSYPKGTGLLILLSVLLAAVPVLFYKLTLNTRPTILTITTTFFNTLASELALIVFEEIVFRGALWAYLRSFGASEQVAFYVQAFLFWIAHYRYLLLGYQVLVLGSDSLHFTPTWCHGLAFKITNSWHDSALSI